MPNYKGHNVECLTPTKKAIIDKATEPYNALSEGPFKTSLEDMEGVFRKEIVSYSVKNGYVYKETTVRDFKEGDYHDTVKIETIHKLD